jgi:hypothetical protein
MFSPSISVRVCVIATLLLLAACGDDSGGTPTVPSTTGDAGASSPAPDGGRGTSGAGAIDSGPPLRADRFITKVVSFTPGPCAGFGADDMPGIVLGPPDGAGATQGSLDVVSLGIGGELVVSFEPNAIVDGPGPDFIVFENAFYAAGNPNAPAADPGEVSVSEDGVTWKTYDCPDKATAPYGKCAGWHPVYSAPGNGISPVDPVTAGGEAYDLSELGLAKAQFVRIRDRSSATCEGQPKPQNLGFDLDAISIVNAETP